MSAPPARSPAAARRSRTTAIATVLLAIGPGAAGLHAQSVCAADTPVRLDHVVVAVGSLETAANAYRSAGFTLEDGRLHENGLLNRHAKFADGTEIEIMSLAAPATDAMARGYADFLEQGDGGAYLALAGPTDWVRERGRAAGLDARILEAGGFRYVTFGEPELAQIFFIEQAGVPDDASITTHPNGARGLRDVGVEGGPRLASLLRAVGAVPCAPAAAEGTDGWALSAGGRVTLLPLRPGVRPRVRWVSLAVGPDAPGDTIPANRAGGIRIGFARDP